MLKAFFTVEGSRESYSERLRRSSHSSVSSLLEGLAQTRAELVLGTAGDVFQVSYKETDLDVDKIMKATMQYRERTHYTQAEHENYENINGD